MNTHSAAKLNSADSTLHKDIRIIMITFLNGLLTGQTIFTSMNTHLHGLYHLHNLFEQSIFLTCSGLETNDMINNFNQPKCV